MSQVALSLAPSPSRQRTIRYPSESLRTPQDRRTTSPPSTARSTMQARPERRNSVSGADASASAAAPPPASALASFIGSEPIFLTLSATTFPVAEGLETQSVTETANASALVKLTYNYTPAASVPSRGTLALGMVGIACLLGLGGWRSKRVSFVHIYLKPCRPSSSISSRLDIVAKRTQRRARKSLFSPDVPASGPSLGLGSRMLSKHGA